MIYEMSIKNYELKESHLWTHRNWCNQFSKWYKKIGKLLTSHRSTTYPCYLPILGEFCRSWPYKTCRLQIYI